MRIPYATEVQIVRRRMEATVEEVIEEFGISRGTLNNIMNRNKEFIEEIKADLRREAMRESSITASDADARE